MIYKNEDQYDKRSRSKIKITTDDLDHGKDQDQSNGLDLFDQRSVILYSSGTNEVTREEGQRGTIV